MFTSGMVSIKRGTASGINGDGGGGGGGVVTAMVELCANERAVRGGRISEKLRFRRPPEGAIGSLAFIRSRRLGLS